jgi:hypothetical protein
MTIATEEIEYTVKLRRPHTKQEPIRQSKTKRKIVRAGRRGGKTVIAATICVDKLLEGLRPLYATPTSDQLETWWFEVKRALAEPIDAGIYKKNETEHTIERVGTKNRIKGKTAWNADTLRGDYSDFLVLDEYQLMNEDTWEVVGAPMLLDNNGDAMFIYTPPSLRSAGVSKARDPRHAAKMFKRAQEDKTGRWEAFHFSSHDNPYISEEALGEIIQDMSSASYRQEIMAEDDELQTRQLVYHKFNEATCKIPRFPLDDEAHKHWPRFVGHDFGGANPAALFIAQDPGTGYFYAYHEYLPGPGRATPQHTTEFKRITEGATVLKRVGGSHQEEGWRNDFTNHGWPIQEPKEHMRNVKVQIDKVIGLMELNKYFIFNDLYHYLEEIMNCLWKRDSDGVITDEIQDEQRYHLCACARYILSDFTPETVYSGKAQEAINDM